MENNAVKALYILDSPSQYDLCRSHAASRGFSLENISIFCPQITVHTVPLDIQAQLVSAPSFSAEERGRIDEEAEKLAGSWSKIPGIASAASYHGLNLAEMLEHGMDYFFVWLMRQAKETQKIFESVKPEKVFIAFGEVAEGHLFTPKESYYGKFFQALTVSKKVPYEIIASEKLVKTKPLFPLQQNFLEGLIGRTINTFSKTYLTLCRKKPSVIFSSLRVAESLLNEKLESSPWLFLTQKPSPKMFLRLAMRGISTACLSVGSTGNSAKNWMEAWKEARTALETSSLFHFEGFRLAEIASHRFERLFLLDFSELAAHADAMNSVLGFIQPEMVVLDEDVTVFKRLFVNLSQQHGAPSVVIQHGITGQRRGYAPSSSTAMAVWGEISKKQLVSWGLEENRIHVTGFPMFDHGNRHKKDPQTVSRVSRALNIPQNAPMILFTPCRLRLIDHGFLRIKMSREQNAAFFRSVALAMKALPEAFLVAKLHPGENLAYAQELLSDLPEDTGSRIRVVRDFDLYDLIHSADALVNISSTVSVEAMLHDIPVINLNLFGMADFIPYGEPSCVISARTQEELESALKQVLAQPGLKSDDRKRFIRNYCGFLDNQSTDRLMALLRSVRAAERSSSTPKAETWNAGLAHARKNLMHSQT